MSERATSTRAGAKDRALGYVRDRILTGEFRGGDLLSEGEVAKALDMSRTPVREAFLRLEAEGLLKLFPQRGALVVPVSPEEVRSVMEARLVLESFAIEKIVNGDRDRLRRVVDRMEAELERQRRVVGSAELRAFLDADRAFHTAMIEAAENSVFTPVYASLRDRQLRMIGESAVASPGRLESIIAEHEAIARAIAEHDLDGARHALRHHLGGTVLALGLAAGPVF
ncbi:GntR family transcriptional regulator [Pseudonocardia sp.]|uniref:GntR family transcriptional regulator n=1 Tax=Pseudonocardia sp. TaxID=60912 RepID=UPI003D09CD25